MYRSVVAVGAHPDDVEGGCGGTLIKLADAGCRVTMVSITNGDKGSFDEPDIDVVEVARIRDAESRAAAATIGATYVCLGQEDQFLFDGREVRLALAGLDFDCASDVLVLDLDHPDAGDVKKALAPYSTGLNQRLMRQTFQATDFLQGFPVPAIDALAALPAATVCETKAKSEAQAPVSR